MRFVRAILRPASRVRRILAGCIADQAMLPRHAKISANINYRAAVATLIDRDSGILDIL
tara:strand:- start:8983 stop:9159 length:177 start_codon:yes stop_codon:yes gene_type:complete